VGEDHKLKSGSKDFEFNNWHLGAGGMQFALFPWHEAEVGSLKKPKVYSVSLVEHPKKGVGGSQSGDNGSIASIQYVNL
jgi:hypothetical protein